MFEIYWASSAFIQIYAVSHENPSNICQRPSFPTTSHPYKTHSPASQTQKPLLSSKSTSIYISLHIFVSFSITSPHLSSTSRSKGRVTSWVTSIATRRPAQLLVPKRHPTSTRSRALASRTQNLTFLKAEVGHSGWFVVSGCV